MNNYKIYLLFSLAALTLVNVFTGSIACLIISYLIIFAMLSCLKIADAAIVFLLLSSVFGAFYAQNGIRFIGSILMFVSSIYLLIDIMKSKKPVLNFFWPVLLFWTAAIISSVTSSGGSYSMEKILTMVLNSIVYIIAFLHLALFREKHIFSAIGIIFIIIGLFELCYMNELLGVRADLSSLFISFAGIRQDISQYTMGGKEVFTLNYQAIGMHGCLGLVFMLFDNKTKLSGLYYIMAVISFFVVWYSSARQAILVFAFIILTYFTIHKKMKFSYILLLGFVVLTSYLFLFQLDSQSYGFLIGENEGRDSARDFIMQTAMSQYKTNPLTGVGFGRFFIDGEYGNNEHNLFVELLTEMGIIGLLLFVILFMRSFTNSWSSLKRRVVEVSPFLLLLMSYFIRSMVSSDLRETIIVLIIPICISVYLNYNAVEQNG